MTTSSLRQYQSLLATYLRPQTAKVVVLAVLLFARTALRLAAPLLTAMFIDRAIAGAPSDSLAMLALIFIGLVVVNQAVTATASYISEQVSWTATNLLRIDLLLHCLRLDMSFHTAHSPGELIERIDGDVAALGGFFSHFVFVVLGNSLFLLGGLLVLWWQDWRAGLLLTIFLTITLLALRRVQGVAIPYLSAIRQVKAEISSFSEERLTGIEDISANGGGGYIMRRLHVLLGMYLRKQRIGSLMSRSFSSTLEICSSLGVAAVLTLGAYLLSQGQMSIGTIYLTMYYSNILSSNLVEIITQIDQFQNAIAGIQRINEMYHTPSKIQDGAGATLPPGPLAVSFERVGFGYTADQPVLHDISFELAPGETLGLLGNTGSGKTTIGRLLFRLYDPAGGAICLGGVDIRTLRLTELRRRIGLVTQDVQLIQATVRDNLTWFNQDIPDERILGVLEDLGLGTWLATLPAGLDTLIGSTNTGLSSGEAQLLAFARVFLQQPDLIILDEASARLDPLTERRIEHAVGALLRGRTALVIAHRLSTLAQVDQIMILEGGRVREQGRRAQLEQAPDSRFSTLLSASRGDTML